MNKIENRNSNFLNQWHADNNNSVRYFLNMECFTNLYVILAQGPCQSLYCSNFVMCCRSEYWYQILKQPNVGFVLIYVLPLASCSMTNKREKRRKMSPFSCSSHSIQPRLWYPSAVLDMLLKVLNFSPLTAVLTLLISSFITYKVQILKQHLYLVANVHLSCHHYFSDSCIWTYSDMYYVIFCTFLHIQNYSPPSAYQKRIKYGLI